MAFDMACISVEEFHQRWERAAHNITGFHSTQEIECQPDVTRANNRLHGSKNKQRNAQYGRLLPGATDEMLSECLQVRETDIFVDIGHGLGNAVMQAAYTHGCTSRGIELVTERYDLSLKFQRELEEFAGRVPVELRNGQLQEVKHRNFLTESGKHVMKVFCNNDGNVFGARSALQAPYLNDFVAGLFASMKEGSKIVTFDPLTFQVGPLDDVNKERNKFKMKTSEHSSFYTMERKVLGPQNQCLSWSEGGVNDSQMTMFVYTRV